MTSYLNQKQKKKSKIINAKLNLKINHLIFKNIQVSKSFLNMQGLEKNQEETVSISLLMDIVVNVEKKKTIENMNFI